MDRSQFVILFTLAFAVIASIPAARSSRRKDKIVGGLLAEVFHHLGVTAYLGIVPAALIGSILVGPLELGIPLALLCLGLTMIALLLYAIFEKPPRAMQAKSEDRGWTEQDARTSGL
jgi:hypothetical protein